MFNMIILVISSLSFLYIIHFKNCIVVYLALGCCPSFNKAIKATKIFIKNEWKE